MAPVVPNAEVNRSHVNSKVISRFRTVGAPRATVFLCGVQVYHVNVFVEGTPRYEPLSAHIAPVSSYVLVNSLKVLPQDDWLHHYNTLPVYNLRGVIC